MTTNRTTNNFDFLRFLAASFVIVTHGVTLLNRVGEDPFGKLSSNFFPMSFYGVRIFFIISGYLIAQSLEHSQGVIDYLWKRVLRLFPGLIVVVCLTVFVVGPLFTNLSFKEYFYAPATWNYLKTILIFRTGIKLPGVFQNNPYNSNVNGSLWTLAYEFSCYLALIIFHKAQIFSKRWLYIPLFILGMYFGFLNRYNNHGIPIYSL